MSVDAKIMTVVSAMKQSLQMAGGPGSSVNSHPNPFFLNVTGEINLKHMAELIVTRLEDYETALKSKLEKLAKESEVRLAKELGTGELKVEITKV
jgi:methionine-rich copper-binding protein CopC